MSYAARLAAELAPATTAGGDMLSPLGPRPGTPGLEGDCRLQLWRLMAGCAGG